LSHSRSIIKQRRWQLVAGFAISAIFLWLALGHIDLSLVWQQVAEANYWWLLPAFLAYFVTVGLRAVRWEQLLRPVQPVAARRLFGIQVLGYLGNNIYPFRIGELLRVYLLRRRENVSFSTGLATLVIERLFDGLAVLLLLVLALPLAPLPGEMQPLVLFTGVLFGLALLVFLLLAMAPGRVLAFWLSLPVPVRWQEPVTARLRRFIAGFSSLQSGWGMGQLLGFSLIIWLLETAKYWLVMQAFPFVVSFAVLLLTNGVINLATILPSAPGFVGTFDLPGIFMLRFFGVPDTVATAFILVLHAVLWLPSTLFGFAYMVYAGIRWTDFGRAAQSV
jgi:glycosyltransferase 2 family protein